MQKILSFGAIAVMGVAAQNQSGPWGTSNRNTMFGGSLMQGNSFQGSMQRAWGGQQQQNFGNRLSQGVSAPCGCQQACAMPVKTLATNNCCAVANPCDEEEDTTPQKTCQVTPEKALTSNPFNMGANHVCSHITLQWATPWHTPGTPSSQAQCEMPQMFQIRVKTSDANWEDLAATSARVSRPPGFTDPWQAGTPGAHYYRVSSDTLMDTPFLLDTGDVVHWKVRAWNTNGWGEWSEDMAGDAIDNSVPSFRPSNSAPGGSVCINSWWNGKCCVDPSGECQKQTSSSTSGKTTCPKDQACVESCDTRDFRKPKTCVYQNDYQKICCEGRLSPPTACNCEDACSN